MHDSHIHLAMEPLATNIIEIITRFTQHGGKYILTQGTEQDDWGKNLSISKKYSDIVQCAIGIHPTRFEESSIQQDKDICEVSTKEIKRYENFFRENLENITAIGECGLDYYQFNLNTAYTIDEKEQLKEMQKIALRKQLQLAKEYNLPLSIHAREENGSDECIKDTLRILAEEGNGILRGSFHSYTGKIEHLEEIVDIGFHLGFNAIITYKSGEDVREILKKTPIDRILFETDGPFLPPQSVRKNKKISVKFAQPADIKEIIEVASEVKDCSYETFERESDENYEQVFLN